MCICVVLHSQPLLQTQLIILLCHGLFPCGFEPENLKGFSYLLRGLVAHTGLLETDVLQSFSVVDQK